MSKIFVSYSRHDLETVDRIVGKVEDAGMKVWIDRDDIKAGKTWRAQIVQAIDTCDAFVLMLSSHSAISENVRKEIDLAQDSGRTVFIIRLDSVMRLPAEMRYQLVGLQYIDIQTLGVDEGIQQLIATLKEHFATSGPVEGQTVRQAEIVIQGVGPGTFGAEKQEQLIDFVAELTRTPDSQLQITKVTTGSLHVFVDMPAAAAFHLKAQALNRDRRLKRFGVRSMRLAGDKKYVNVTLGILTTTATIGLLNMLWINIPSLLPALFGVTAGKVLFITTALVAAAGIAVPYANALTPQATPTPTLIPTAAQTPVPRNLLVLNDTLCWNGPGQSFAEISSVMAGTRVELLGRGSLTGWLIILNPRYQVPCWMRIRDLQMDPDYDIAFLPIFTPASTLAGKSQRHSGDGPTPTVTAPCSFLWVCNDLNPALLTAIASTQSPPR